MQAEMQTEAKSLHDPVLTCVRKDKHRSAIVLLGESIKRQLRGESNFVTCLRGHTPGSYCFHIMRRGFFRQRHRRPINLKAYRGSCPKHGV